MDILKKILIITISTILAIIMLVIISKTYLMKASNNYENSNSETAVSNGGIVVKQGNYIYYKNGLPNTNGWFTRFRDNGKLYKINTDGTDKVKICNDFAENINILEHSLFYAVSNDLNSTILGFSIFKIETNGSNRINICHASSKDFIISSNWIYFIDGNSVNKVKIDGTSKTCLIDAGNGFIKEMQLSNGWMFYTDDSQNNNIFTVKTDGGKKHKVNNDSSGHIKIVGEWIYYSDSLTNSKVYKIRKDGTGRKEVSNEEAKAKYYRNNKNVVGDWLYYITGSEINTCQIFRSKINSTEEVKLSDDYVDYFTGIDIVENWIYYVNKKDNCIYKIRFDGTSKSKV